MVALTFKFRAYPRACQPMATQQTECCGSERFLGAVWPASRSACGCAANAAATNRSPKTKVELNALARNDRKTNIADALTDIRTFDTINDEACGLAPDGHTINLDRGQRGMNVGRER